MSPDDRSGIVAFLFTDIEGSTRLWEQNPDTMRAAMASHDAILQNAVERYGGTVVKFLGDGVHASFDDPLKALEAALAIQASLADAPATGGIQLKVRCGLHVGRVERRAHDFFGNAVNRAARIMGVAHGGQVLISHAAAALVGGRLPATVELRDLGRVRLRDMAEPEQVYQVLHPDLRRDFPALRSLEATPNNLPRQMTSFLGRERELQELKLLLAKSRVVTLLGTGGIGKTRLSLQLGAGILDAFPDGVWWVDLASVSDPALVPHALAHVLGLTEEAGTPLTETICRQVCERHTLLLLDNCEHVLAACARVVDALIKASRDIRIIATSREPLQIGGEQSYLLPTLSLAEPDADLAALMRSDSARLFIERARLRQPQFEATEEQAATIAKICAQLDGIPLALELAAARVGSLSVETLAARLDDRFALLTHGLRTALPRQQTLRAMIDWSYDLLGADEKSLFCRLSVFAAGWTLDAAETVLGGADLARSDVLDVLDRLIQKSLVLVFDSGDRYRMLETVRAYARDKLSETGDEYMVRGRHHEYFLALAEASEPAWRSRADEAKWLPLLDKEHENIKAALHWSLQSPGLADNAMRICGAMGHFWRVRGHWREGRAYCSAALQRDSERTSKSVRAKAFFTASLMSNRLGETREAEMLLKETLKLARETQDRMLEASVLNNLGNIVYDHGDFAQALALLEEAVAINRQLGNRAQETINLGNIGEFLLGEGDFAAARVPFERALILSHELGNRSLEAAALANLGLLAERVGHHVKARSSAAQSLAIYRELVAPAQEAEQLARLAVASVACGDLPTAADHFDEVLRASRRLGYRRSIVVCFEGMVIMAVKVGDWMEAATLWGAAKALRSATGVLATPSEGAYFGRYRDQSRAAIGDATFIAAESAGHAMPLDAAVNRELGWLAAVRQR